MENITEDVNEEIKHLPILDEILQPLQIEAERKKLNIYIFDNEDLKQYFTPKYKDVGVVTISKDGDGAIWNLQRFRHSFLFRSTV